MKSQARVVVIGGGIAGCSALYHLTQEGWSDVVLLERDELTSGTTWHSAAQVTAFGAIQVMVGLKAHSIKLYKELAADPEYPVGYHHGDGGLRLASQEWHLDGYKHFISMAKGMGVDYELLPPEECARRHPLITTDGLVGALWDGEDGDIDPAQLCQALARRARLAGAEVYRKTPVTGLQQAADGDWIVETNQGDIRCEHVVNAGGYRCNEIAAMMGVELPVASMEHQYFVTEEIPELAALDHRVPLIRCPTDDFYQRQEKNGLLVGFYEQGCKTWGLDGIDPNFTMALCPNDLDRVADVFENAVARLPCLAAAGIHTIVNGPITYTPDGVPLVGRIPGRRNAWCITGLRAGLGEGGGHGWLLAQQIVHGEACYDTWALDPRRFTQHADVQFTAKKAVEDYQNEFRFHLPHEHRPAGREAKTTPLYPALRDAGAAFGVVNGWERVAHFKPAPDFEEAHSFRFNNTFGIVAEEVRTVHERVGIMEVSGFNRVEVSGRGAQAWLEGLICGRVPSRVGKVGLGYTLSAIGTVLSEATIAVIGEDRIWWGSAAAAEYHDMDWLMAQNPPKGVTVKSLTNEFTTLVVAGPRARALLSAVAPDIGWSADAFPWLTVRGITISGADIIAMSVSFSGELAWELHIPNSQLVAVYRILLEAGGTFGLGGFGLYATEFMRLEKGYGHWKADFITEFDPFESGLERFVKMDKEFVGKAALATRQSSDPGRRLATFVLDTTHAPAHPGDSVMVDGKVVGSVTSAAWGHRVSENLAMAFVDAAYAEIGANVEVEVLGERFAARSVRPCRFDPENERLRN
jgi:dimethylglycine dehydrogenase